MTGKTIKCIKWLHEDLAILRKFESRNFGLKKTSRSFSNNSSGDEANTLALRYRNSDWLFALDRPAMFGEVQSSAPVKRFWTLVSPFSSWKRSLDSECWFVFSAFIWSIYIYPKVPACEQQIGLLLDTDNSRADGSEHPSMEKPLVFNPLDFSAQKHRLTQSGSSAVQRHGPLIIRRKKTRRIVFLRINTAPDFQLSQLNWAIKTTNWCTRVSIWWWWSAWILRVEKEKCGKLANISLFRCGVYLNKFIAIPSFLFSCCSFLERSLSVG